MKEKIKKNKSIILLAVAVIFLLVALVFVFGKTDSSEEKENNKKDSRIETSENIIGITVRYQMDPATKVEISVAEDSSFITRRTFYDKNVLRETLSEEELIEYEDRTVYYTYNYLPSIESYVQGNILDNKEDLEKYRVEEIKEEQPQENENQTETEEDIKQKEKEEILKDENLWSITIKTPHDTVKLESPEDYPSFWYGLLTVLKEDYMYEQESVKDRDYTKMMYDRLGEPDREVLRIHYLKAEDYVNEHLGIKDGDICVNLFADDLNATSSYKLFSTVFTQAMNGENSTICLMKKVKNKPDLDYDLKLDGYDTLYLVINEENDFGYDFYMKVTNGLDTEYYKANIDASDPENNEYIDLLNNFNNVKEWITVPCIEYYKNTDDGNPQMVSDTIVYSVSSTGTEDNSDTYFDNMIVISSNETYSQDDILNTVSNICGGKIIGVIQGGEYLYYLYMTEECYTRDALISICSELVNTDVILSAEIITKEKEEESK